ncbi:Synaptic vesicle membrane protein VAT-1 isoform 1 [Schistosoma japonicum]|uniref:Synaptic vesicle membrane protein VAT-1 isoform 1 n=1 Tax=Schistosoma japonicum TaxID=6182 RepID=A0A4Z2CQ63_SCHJA|nr:Synaptic vesicle membrane protein VAT-1 isoform 1 [Schistosoma japonicum]TNN06397.1 Synaptic vesicle membrane protein VAT-1 isoform 1 [Schistosoma japonicum]
MPEQNSEEVDKMIQNETTETTELSNENTVSTEKEIKTYKCATLGVFGSSKHIRIDSNEVKPVGKNEIAIDVQACGINFHDIMTRQGLIEQTMKPPFVLGSECTGIISEVGEKVTTYKVGDPVVILLENGAWSERLVLPVVEKVNANQSSSTTTPPNEETEATESVEITVKSIILPRPKTLDVNKAAIIGFAYIPAYILIHNILNIRPGEIVLVQSAGGGVGTAVGQLLKLIPNVTLIGVASKVKHEKLADIYDVLLEPDQDCVTEIKKLYPNGIHAILDCISGPDTNKLYGILKPLGKHVIYGMSNLVTGDRKNFLNLAKHWFHMERISPLKLHDENLLLAGFSLKSLLFSRDHIQTEVNNLIIDVWNELIKLIDDQKIDPIIDSQWYLNETKEAMMRLQERKNIGKVVLIPKLKEEEKPENETVQDNTNVDKSKTTDEVPINSSTN